MIELTFYAAAAIAVFSTVMTITSLNPVHALLYLIVSLLSVAVIFFLLGAPFAALLEVIVYAGAIMVLFVFAIMVLIPGKEETGPDPRRSIRLLALPIAALLLGVLVMVLATRRGGPAAAPAVGGVESLGRLLFTDYLFPFELTSVLLLAAMVGVLVLARRRTS